MVDSAMARCSWGSVERVVRDNPRTVPSIPAGDVTRAEAAIIERRELEERSLGVVLQKLQNVCDFHLAPILRVSH